MTWFRHVSSVLARTRLERSMKREWECGVLACLIYLVLSLIYFFDAPICYKIVQ